MISQDCLSDAVWLLPWLRIWWCPIRAIHRSWSREINRKIMRPGKLSTLRLKSADVWQVVVFPNSKFQFWIWKLENCKNATNVNTCQFVDCGFQRIAAATLVRSAPSFGLALRAAYSPRMSLPPACSIFICSCSQFSNFSLQLENWHLKVERHHTSKIKANNPKII